MSEESKTIVIGNDTQSFVGFDKIFVPVLSPVVDPLIPEGEKPPVGRLLAAGFIQGRGKVSFQTGVLDLRD